MDEGLVWAGGFLLLQERGAGFCWVEKSGVRLRFKGFLSG